MTGIEKISKIKREALSGEHYFQSLLEQAYVELLLSDSEIEKIQFECLALLAKQTERYNGGDSSSIRIEKAQNIFSSVLFTIGVQLKTYPSPDDAIIALQRYGVEKICIDGRIRIDRLVKQVKMRHASLIKCLLQTENVFYASTIIDGIKGFFKLYYPDFAAQETHITADYPVYNRTERLQGIEFIGKYSEYLYYENAFCIHFPTVDIHHLLCGYDERYQELLFNIYELVLAASLGCVIAGANVKRLEITPEVQSFLRRQFDGKGRTEIEQMLTAALSNLSSIFLLPDSLLNYTKQSMPILAISIENASKTGTLDQIFVLPKYPEDEPRLIISFGVKMDDELYRRVLDEFMGCQSIADKVDIIKEQICSLADLNDLLMDAELSADEMMLILKRLSLPEIAALTKKYCLEYHMSFIELRDAEKTLCEGLQRLVSTLPLEQRNWLEKAVKVLTIN